MLAGGSVGYGEALPSTLNLGAFGAVVVGPITRHSRRGSEPPRLAESVAGLVLQTGLQNRGVRSVLRDFARLWPRLGLPVVAQVADAEPEDALVTGARLAQAEGVAGLELLLARDADRRQAAELVKLLVRRVDLPLLVKLPLERAAELAGPCVDAGASGLVVGRPPLGAAIRPDGVTIRGDYYGPGVFPVMLAALLAVKDLGLPCSLTACGGVHTREQAHHCLAAGADAVQLDSVVWVEPDFHP